MADVFDKVLGQLSGQTGRSRVPRMELYRLPLGTAQPCLACGDLIELREMPDYKQRPFRYWSDCRCIGQAADRSIELTEQSRAYAADQRTEVIADPVPIAAFTFDTFDAGRLNNGVHVLSLIRGWLLAINGLGVAPSYHDKPRACLYFYSAGKGRGKTHLAGAITNQVRADGRRAVLIDEVSYIESYWAAGFEQRAKLSALPGDQAWLTVIDDLGQKEGATAGLRDAWYDVFNPRWLKRGWTVITSNWTPDELLAHGTINDATYSRLVQMTHGKVIAFDGADQRMTGGAA